MYDGVNLMLRILLSAFFVLLCGGCGGPRYVDYFPYHDNGSPKPKIALMAIKDSSGVKMPWNISEELLESLYCELRNSGEFYVLSPEEIGPIWNKQESIDFFGNNVSSLEDFGAVDFLVVMELVEHSANPCTQKPYASYNCMLNMNMRVKVLDVRTGTPRTILYEVVNASYVIASPKDSVDYTQKRWGTDSYFVTPCCRVHQRMVQNLATRLEEVLLTAK